MPRVAFVSVVFLLSCTAGILVARAGENDLEKLFRQEQVRFIDFTIVTDAKDSESTMQARSRLKSSFVLTHNRLIASIIRLEDIISRVDVVDGEEGKERLEDARSELREAREALKISRADFEEMFLSNNLQDALNNIQTDIDSNIIARLQNAHKILVELILDLKQAKK